jgi:hypothetical protein
MSQTVQLLDDKTIPIGIGNPLTGAHALAATANPITVTGQAVKVGVGRLFGTMLTTALAGVLTFYDNATAASGRIVLQVPAAQAVDVWVATLAEGVPFVNGLWAAVSVQGGQATVAYS